MLLMLPASRGRLELEDPDARARRVTETVGAAPCVCGCGCCCGGVFSNRDDEAAAAATSDAAVANVEMPAAADALAACTCAVLCFDEAATTVRGAGAECCVRAEAGIDFVHGVC